MQQFKVKYSFQRISNYSISQYGVFQGFQQIV